MITFKKEGYTPLAVREDADGKLWIKAKALDAITAKQAAAISGETCGWGAHLLSICTATGAWAYIGFPLSTQATGDYAYYQIGGYASNCLFGASVSASGMIGIAWASCSIVSIGAAASSSLGMQYGVFGYQDADDASTATHDLFLFGQMILNSDGPAT